jgi:hypothetical protein
LEGVELGVLEVDFQSHRLTGERGDIRIAAAPGYDVIDGGG